MKEGMSGNAEGWLIAGSDERATGTYFFLNIRVRDGRGRVTVKARTDGTYLCLNSECVRSGRPLLHARDVTGGCAHARFVRDHDAGVPASPTNDDAPPHDDGDAPPDDTTER